MSKAIPISLRDVSFFTRNDYNEVMSREYGMTDTQIAYDLQKRLDNGTVIHVGWNRYSVAGTQMRYHYHYSETAEEISQIISEQFVDVNYQITELVQLNEFMNHQVAHNTIFVFVENDMQDYVFGALHRKYPGKVMLRPSLEEYYRYVVDEMIIVMRLPSESPKGFNQPWQSRLEKILVDILTDKLLSEIVPEGEKSAIYIGAINDYLVDRETMTRYAKRKGAVTKLNRAIERLEES